MFEELSLEELEKKDEGLDTLIAFFDQKTGHLSTMGLADSFQKFEEFEACVRGSESIGAYIQTFVQRHNRLIKLKMTLSEPVLAFKFLTTNPREVATVATDAVVLSPRQREGMDITRKEIMQ